MKTRESIKLFYVYKTDILVILAFGAINKTIHVNIIWRWNAKMRRTILLNVYFWEWIFAHSEKYHYFVLKSDFLIHIVKVYYQDENDINGINKIISFIRISVAIE